VRNPVRKFLGVALIGMLGVFVAAPAIAGAQTTTTTLIPGVGIGSCTYTVPTTVAPNSPVTVSGSAPGGVTVQLFVGGAITPTQEQTLSGSPSTLVPFTFTFTAPATGSTSASVNYVYGGTGEAAGNSYVADCIGDAGLVVTRISVGGEIVVRPLAFTGSSNTPTYLLIGFGALAVGVVLVVASRRRSRVHG
jgi:LPXTG-motif cell wall-anchored protein